MIESTPHTLAKKEVMPRGVQNGDYNTSSTVSKTWASCEASRRYIGIFMHVKLAKDYSLLISSHKVGKIVHASPGGQDNGS